MVAGQTRTCDQEIKKIPLPNILLSKTHTQSFVYFSKKWNFFDFFEIFEFKIFGKLRNLFSKVGGKL